MTTGWRIGLALALAAAAWGCGQRIQTKAAARPAAQPPPAPADAVKGYPDAAGSAQALEETLRAQDVLAPEERIATMLRYAKVPAGAKLLEAECARLNQAPADVLALTATVRAKAPGTALAASALATEFAALRTQQPEVFLSRCKDVLGAQDSSAADRAVVLYTRAFHYRDAGRPKAGVLDALRFWTEYPDKVRRMKAAGRLAGLVRDAGFLCEADMLEGSDEPEIVARCLKEEFGPFEILLAEVKPGDANTSRLSAYLAYAPNLDAVEASAAPAEIEPWEKARHLGRTQRLVAYGGDLDRTVDLCREYGATLRALIETDALPDDALPFAYAQIRATSECLRRLLLDPHFVRSATATSSRSSASMRSEQTLGELSLLSLETAERRFEKKQIDETRLAGAYVRHAETLKTVNDSDNTIKAFHRFVERHPQAAEAPGFLQRIGDTYVALKALGSAADAFKELAESYPGASETPTAQLSRITCLYQSEAYEQAYEESTALCAAKPEHPKAADLLMLRGLTEAALQMDDQAAETMREIETRYASSTAAPQALLWLAGRALSSQNYAEARSCFQALADRYPNSDAGQRAPEYLDRLSKMSTVEPRHES